MASWHSSCAKKDVVAIYDRPGMTQLIILYDLMQKHGTLFLKTLANMLWPSVKPASSVIIPKGDRIFPPAACATR
eukprot:2734733-Amphidinium_carterae.1